MNNGKICISICANTADELFGRIGRAEALADVIELRFDCLAPAEVDRALEELPETAKRYLMTYRPSEQGGRRILPPAARVMFWTRAVRALAGREFLIDREGDIHVPAGLGGGRVITSTHFFGEAPADLRGTFYELSDISPGIIKIAVTCKDITDAIGVWRLLEIAEKGDEELIPIAMGEAGKWTRILGPAHGAYMTYGSLDAGSETAPGQISAEDLTEVFRVKELGRETRVYGIVGGDTSYSVSPWMHNAGFRAAGKDLVFIPLQVADLGEFVRRMVRRETREVELNFGGFSVTNPHKQAIIPFLDEVDETAAKIGAVNTVKIEDGKLYGFNTDAPGFITPLKARFGELKDAKVAVAGAGGAARACVYALKQEGADVTLFARSAGKASELAVEFGLRTGELGTDPAEKRTIFRGFDIVVNATPLGTKGDTADKTIATAEEIAGAGLVYDLIYNPLRTRLISEAEKAGVDAIGGLEMLVAQGAKQFELWTGGEAPEDAMEKAVKKKLGL